MITDKSIKEFSQQIGQQKTPVPAGGATTATTALLGVSLLKLVWQVSEDNLEKNIKSHQNELNKIEKQLLQAIEEDTIAFESNLKTNFNDQKRLKEIIEVPLEIAENANNALKVSTKIKNKVKDTVIADYKVAVTNLKSSIKGTIAIIEANYTFFSTQGNYIQEIKAKVDKLKSLYDI
ncbi:hypothetical protein JCM16358_01370 [Halanaerocella petrolearia]